MVTVWCRWSGNLKGREEWDNPRPHGKGQWKENPGKSSAAQDRAGWQKKLQPCAPHCVERTNNNSCSIINKNNLKDNKLHNLNYIPPATLKRTPTALHTRVLSLTT